MYFVSGQGILHIGKRESCSWNGEYLLLYKSAKPGKKSQTPGKDLPFFAQSPIHSTSNYRVPPILPALFSLLRRSETDTNSGLKELPVLSGEGKGW